jgi:hypothetical protein
MFEMFFGEVKMKKIKIIFFLTIVLLSVNLVQAQIEFYDSDIERKYGDELKPDKIIKITGKVIQIDSAGGFYQVTILTDKEILLFEMEPDEGRLFYAAVYKKLRKTEIEVVYRYKASDHLGLILNTCGDVKFLNKKVKRGNIKIKYLKVYSVSTVGR